MFARCLRRGRSEDAVPVHIERGHDDDDAVRHADACQGAKRGDVAVGRAAAIAKPLDE